MALLTTAESIAALEARIPAGIKATRCFRVHSNIGPETEHVAESIRFIATLPPADRAVIAQATYNTIALHNAFQQDMYPGDDAMCSILDEFGWTMPECA